MQWRCFSFFFAHARVVHYYYTGYTTGGRTSRLKIHVLRDKDKINVFTFFSSPHSFRQRVVKVQLVYRGVAQFNFFRISRLICPCLPRWFSLTVFQKRRVRVYHPELYNKPLFNYYLFFSSRKCLVIIRAHRTVFTLLFVTWETNDIQIHFKTIAIQSKARVGFFGARRFRIRRANCYFLLAFPNTFAKSQYLCRFILV